ncbi:hypothetical protein Taro_019399 [Colocasia esculenta]|uniref:Uncharacterized protein n=1 Tax=Colocasia esculenta TaxID=4460 RepID=A0A843UZ51_COLES|nr:hypothetical protein [Colocasia esculenta]
MLKLFFLLNFIDCWSHTSTSLSSSQATLMAEDSPSPEAIGDDWHLLKVDDNLQLFRSIELPWDMLNVEKELLKSNMEPVTNTAKRWATAQVHIRVSEPKAVAKKLCVPARGGS